MATAKHRSTNRSAGVGAPAEGGASQSWVSVIYTFARLRKGSKCSAGSLCTNTAPWEGLGSAANPGPQRSRERIPLGGGGGGGGVGWGGVGGGSLRGAQTWGAGLGPRQAGHLSRLLRKPPHSAWGSKNGTPAWRYRCCWDPRLQPPAPRLIPQLLRA